MWTYEQKTGKLFDKDGILVATGYSGTPAHKNNPDSQHIRAEGPAPRGEYKLGQPHTSAKTGPYVMNMEPKPGNEMFGRSAFQIHGDSIKKPGTASNGCLVFARNIREKIWNSGDHEIEVVKG